MIRKTRFIVLLLSVAVMGSFVSEAREGMSCQTSEAALAGEIHKLLVQEGFENVAIRLDVDEKQEVTIEYENRRYRYELRAMGLVCRLVASLCPGIDWLTLIPKHRDIPLVMVRISLPDYEGFTRGEIATSDFASRIEISQDIRIAEPGAGATSYQTGSGNGSSGKIDLFIHPDVNVRLGNYDDPYKWQLNIIPEMCSFPFKGTQASIELIIPLKNELGEEGDDIRPGKVMLNHTRRLGGQIFGSLSVGYFDLHRYGISAELLRFLLNGNLSVSARVDYTGFLIYMDKRWFYSDLNKWTYLLSGVYQFSALDFSVGLSHGRFIMGDVGWRVDALRSFGEIDIGFFAIQTDAEKIGGLNFRVPLYPMRRSAPHRMRVSPPLYLSRCYRYRYTDYGTGISTGSSLRDFNKRLTPGYIRNHVEEFRRVN